MRIINRPLAFLLAAALAAAAIFVVIDVVSLALHAHPVVFDWPTWGRWASRTQWNAEAVKVWSIILLVAGLILVVGELKPPRPTRIPITSDAAATDAAITRKGIAGAVRAAAEDVDGVTRTAAAVNRRAITVTAAAAATDKAAAEALRQPVTAAVQAKLDTLGLRHTPQVRVRVNARST